MYHPVISTLSEGNVASIIGRITEVDDRPMTITTQDGKVILTHHVVLTDATRSIQMTMWDRTAEFENFRLGDVVVVEDVTARSCEVHFKEYGDLALIFSRGSRIGPPVHASAQGDERLFPRASIRSVIRPTKREQEFDVCRSGCEAPTKPFCARTGKPHAFRCNICRETAASHPFCPDTGLPHV